MEHLVQLAFGGCHAPCCYLQCRQRLFMWSLQFHVGRKDTTPLTGKEMKPRQEVCPGLKVGELAFEPRGPDSQPGTLLSPGVTTVDFHLAFSGQLGGQKLAPQRA